MLKATTRFGFPAVLDATHPQLPIRTQTFSQRWRAKLHLKARITPEGDAERAAMDKRLTGLTAAYQPPEVLVKAPYRDPPYPWPGEKDDSTTNVPNPTTPAGKKTIEEQRQDRLVDELFKTPPPKPGWYLTCFAPDSAKVFRYWNGSWSLGMALTKQYRSSAPDYYRDHPSGAVAEIFWIREAQPEEI